MSIITPNSPEYWKFEKMEIHETLLIVREQNKKIVIGYVNKHPDDFWYWFMLNDVSFTIKGDEGKFETSDDAIGDLAQSFITVKMNAMTQKITTKI